MGVGDLQGDVRQIGVGIPLERENMFTKLNFFINRYLTYILGDLCRR